MLGRALAVSVTVAVSLSVFALGCSDSGNPVASRFDSLNLAFTAEDTAEAHDVALYLSGEMRAPSELRTAVMYELAAIRKLPAETTEFVGLRFQAPWEAGTIRVCLDSVSALAVAAGEYQAWDKLNRTLGLVSFELTYSDWYYRLTFDGDLHPIRLAESYLALPGITCGEGLSWGGDWSNVFPIESNMGRLYYFVHKWGDCPSGCISGEGRAYAVSSNEIAYVGYRGEDTYRSEPSSGWHELAELARTAFHEHKHQGTDPPAGRWPGAP
jgi:hypothetical protein